MTLAKTLVELGLIGPGLDVRSASLVAPGFAASKPPAPPSAFVSPLVGSVSPAFGRFAATASSLSLSSFSAAVPPAVGSSVGRSEPWKVSVGAGAELGSPTAVTGVFSTAEEGRRDISLSLIVATALGSLNCVPRLHIPSAGCGTSSLHRCGDQMMF